MATNEEIVNEVTTRIVSLGKNFMNEVDLLKEARNIALYCIEEAQKSVKVHVDIQPYIALQDGTLVPNPAYTLPPSKE